MVRFYFIIVSKCFCLFTVIFNNRNLIILISRSGNGLQAFLQIFYMIFIWNQNGNLRISLHLILDTIKPSVQFRQNFCLLTASRKMGFYGTLSSLKCIGFTDRIIRSRNLMYPPMIKNPRHMRRYRFFHTPENQIVILRSVKFTS